MLESLWKGWWEGWDRVCPWRGCGTLPQGCASSWLRSRIAHSCRKAIMAPKHVVIERPLLLTGRQGAPQLPGGPGSPSSS